MPAGLTNVTFDNTLTSILVGVSNDEHIARQVLDTISSAKEFGQIAAMGNEHYRLDFVERARGADTPRIDWQAAAPIPFRAHEWTIEKAIDDRDDGIYSDPFDAERDATFTIKEKLDLKLEDLVGTLMTTSGNFGSTTAGNAWGTPGTGTPVTNIRAAIAAVRARTGRAALYGCCSYAVWQKLISTTEVRNLYLNTVPGAAAPGNLTPTTIASAIGLKDIYVGAAIKLTSAEGAADTYADVWSATTFAVYAKSIGAYPASPFNTGFAALIIPTVKNMPGVEVVVDKYRDERAISDVVRGRTLYDMIATNPRLGQLITGIT